MLKKLEEEMPIDVKQIDDHDFKAIVSSDIVTHHKVKVADIAYYRDTVGDNSKPQLVTKAFSFLLQKEPNISILSDLNVENLEQYFPDLKI